METIQGVSKRILVVDLQKKTWDQIQTSQGDWEQYLGGKGLGLKLFRERVPKGIDPLSEQNEFIVMTGALTGTAAPCSGRFVAVTKSPITGIMGTGTCGGPFGIALKTSGWDGLILTGRADLPTSLLVSSSGVEFRDARAIWGKDIKGCQSMVAKEGNGSLVIGPAGENKVLYANIASGHRFLGRCGMGAVLGSKNIKAIVARGKEYKVGVRDRDAFERARQKILKYINRNFITSHLYRLFGTPANVNLSNRTGLLPVRNYKGGSHGQAYRISGEEMAKAFDTGFSTCNPCSIMCGHRGQIKGQTRQIPEYETIGTLGSNLCLFDPVAVSELNEICNGLGLDTISTGNTLAWAMEATEKGLLDTGLRFGSMAGLREVIEDIAHRRGLGEDLAMGTRRLSLKYGGVDFAMNVKGLELAAYDPRGAWGQALSYAVANRGGCHLSSASFVVEAYLDMQGPFSIGPKAPLVSFLEDVNCAINSMVMCLFTAFAIELEPFVVKYTPRPLLKLMLTYLTPIALKFMDVSLWPEIWSATTGIPMGMSKWIEAGRRIHVLERYMNSLEGISRKDDTLPQRFLTEARACDDKGRTVPLDQLLASYYSFRGYDQNGVPTKGLLKRLNIEP